MNMVRRWALPPVMVAVALLLGWWWRKDGSQSVQQPLARIAVQRVVTLRVAGPDVSATFVRAGDAWKQTEPFEQPADAPAIRALLAAATDAAPVYRVPLAQAPKTSRLDAPDVSLDISVPDQPAWKYRIGADHPAGLAWVAEERAGEGGPAAPELRRLALAALGGSLRDDRLFERAGADSDRIVVDAAGVGGDAHIELVRDAAGWRLKQPFESRADPAAVSAFLQGVARLRHQGVVQANAGDGSLHGLAKPWAQVSVRTLDVATGAPREETVLLGGEGPGGGRFAKIGDRPPVLAVDAKSVAALLPQGAGFVDARACALQPEQVAAVRVLDTEGSERVHLKREPDGWKRLASDGAVSPVEDRNVRELVRSLCEVRAGAIATDGAKPEWLVGSIEVTGSDGAVRTVRLWRLPDGKWAMHDGDGPVRIFSANLPMPIQPQDHPPKR